MIYTPDTDAPTAEAAAAPITPRQVQLIQSSWQALAPAAAQACALFYQRLFEIDASLRPMFGADLTFQSTKLAAMLTAVVVGLSRLDTLVPNVAALGRRHVGYGVQPAHYDTVGRALLWTLERGLQGGATAEVMQAWATAYGVLASVMQAPEPHL